MNNTVTKLIANNSVLRRTVFVFKDRVLRAKVLYVLGAFLIFRLFAAIPMPIVDQAKLEAFLDGNQFMAMISMFSGGGLKSLSIVMLGVMPYITASIIMQLMTMMYPKLKAMQHEEGEIGRKKIANYSRLLTVPLSAVQAFGFLFFLKSQGILMANLSSQTMFFAIVIAVAGSIFLMWIGELITEFGIGNGLSLLIFAGIVGAFPGRMMQLWTTLSADFSQLPLYLAVTVLFLVMIYVIIFITEAERPVPVHNAKTARAGQAAKTIQSNIPIKLNQAGVIPIIFAVSIAAAPSMILQFMSQAGKIQAGGVLEYLSTLMSNQLFTAGLYFVLVFFFTFFYTAVTFDPKEMAKNLQKGGTFVPGVRPGKDTEKYFGQVTTRVTFLGATFLALVAVLPVLISYFTGNRALAIGGTSILIVVSVAIDFIRQLNAKISVREYLSS